MENITKILIFLTAVIGLVKIIFELIKLYKNNKVDKKRKYNEVVGIVGNSNKGNISNNSVNRIVDNSNDGDISNNH